MCREAISPDLEAYTYGDRIFCSRDCAIAEAKYDLASVETYGKPLFKSEAAFEDYLDEVIKDYDTTNLSTPLYCGDDLEVE